MFWYRYRWQLSCKLTRPKAFTVWPTNRIQWNLSDVHSPFISQWNTGYVCLDINVCDLQYACEDTYKSFWPPNACKSLRKFNLWLFAAALAHFDQGLNLRTRTSCATLVVQNSLWKLLYITKNVFLTIFRSLPSS